MRSFTELWPFIFREGMRPLQVKVEEIFQQENKPLAIILEAPMGEGKKRKQRCMLLHSYLGYGIKKDFM